MGINTTLSKAKLTVFQARPEGTKTKSVGRLCARGQGVNNKRAILISSLFFILWTFAN